MVTPVVVGHIDPVCLVEPRDERESPEIDVPGWIRNGNATEGPRKRAN
jgi:hypothetical protein